MDPRSDARGERSPFRVARWVLVPIFVVTLLLVPTVGGVGSTRGLTAFASEAAEAGTSLPALGSAAPPSGVPATLAVVPPALSAPVRWVNVTGNAPGARPPASHSGAMAYDPIDHETVYFGGCAGTQCPNNQTWVFSNGSWANITNLHGAPPARYGSLMDFDANMPGLLLFGGHGVGPTGLNDTWLFRAGLWTNLTRSSPVAPAPREYASMVFDPAPEENGSVLFGGNVFGGGAANDTWVWAGGSGWVALRTSVSPPSSYNAQMAYDPVDGAIVLFGCGYGCITANETWELYSGQWWQLLPLNPIPPYRYSAAMTYDAALSAVVLFGGFGFSGVLNDTWTFSNGVWTDVTASVGPAPPARWEAGISADSSAFPPLLVGGVNFLFSKDNDTWVLEVPPTVGLSATPTSSEASVPVTLSAAAQNGTAPYRALFAFGDGGSALASSYTPSIVVAHSYVTTGTYVPSVRMTDAAGVPAAASAPLGVRVIAGPTLGPLAEPLGGDAGIPIPFTGASVANGTAPFTFLWRFGDGATVPGVPASHAYATAGTYTGTLTVTDALGANSARSFTELVRALPTATIASAPGTPTAGVPATFYGNVSDGTAPYRYSWKFGDGATSSFPYPAHNFTVPGAYTVQLWANDSLGASAHQSLRVSVTTPPPGNGSSGGPSGSTANVPVWFWPGVGALAVVGALGAVVLLRGGRSKT